jgi:exopolysaccharide production protein ExoY
VGSFAEALADCQPLPAAAGYRPELAQVQTAFSRTSKLQQSHRDISTRAMDVALALLALAVIAPVLVLIFVLVRSRDAGPALFAQDRIGRGGEIFRCWKFRTMVLDAEDRLSGLLASDADARTEWQRDRKLRRDPRITSLGRFLRQTSLDELPQLFNVLVGDMSLVGPRPIVSSEIPLYGTAFRKYCDVRPGITGLWQASGRNHVTYRRRVAMDVIYARKRSVTFNVKIMALTVPAVLFGKGSY